MMTVLDFIVLLALAVVGTLALIKFLSVAGMDAYFTPTVIALMIVWLLLGVLVQFGVLPLR